jgi:hypothetical protein
MRAAIRLGIAAAAALAFTPAWAVDTAEQATKPCDQMDMQMHKGGCADATSASKTADVRGDQGAGGGSGEPQLRTPEEEEFLQTVWSAP